MSSAITTKRTSSEPPLASSKPSTPGSATRYGAGPARRVNGRTLQVAVPELRASLRAAPLAHYSHLSLAFAASFEYHCLMDGHSAPPRLSGTTWSTT